MRLLQVLQAQRQVIMWDPYSKKLYIDLTDEMHMAPLCNHMRESLALASF